MKKLFLLLVLSFGLVTVQAQENPFAEYDYTPKVATLSQGQFNEFHDQDTIVQIGSVLFNTKSKQIVAFVEYDTMYSEATLEPDIVSRWMSPDPLAENYTSLSPYQFTNNSPIYNLEADGRYFTSYSSKYGGSYTIHVTNHHWVDKVSKLSAIPYLGIPFEGALWAARGQDPSFKATKSDYAGLAFQAIGAGSLKLAQKLGKVSGTGAVLLDANRQATASLITMMSNPGTEEVGIDYLAVKSLEEEGLGSFHENKSGEKMTSEFRFNKDFVKNIEDEIMSNEELTSKDDFNLQEEVQSRLSTIMDDKKAEIKKSMDED